MAKKVKEIKDSYFVTYGIFYSMGVLTNVPHQFLTNSTSYWMFKFRNPYPYPHPTDPPGPPPGPGPGLRMYDYNNTSDVPKDRTPLQANFTASLHIASQVSMLGFLIITALYAKKLPPPPRRILGALFSMLVLFLIQAAFVWINTDTFQEVFFGIALVLAIFLNVTSAVTMISLFEMVARFPLDYYGAILSGQALCGIISSSLQILTLSLYPKVLYSATIYFSVGSVLILCTTIFYLITKKKSKYFIYRIGEYEGNNIMCDKWTLNWNKMKAALQRTKWIMGAMVFVQGSTAMIHPGLSALVVSEYRDSENPAGWSGVYFVPVITFFFFHLSDFVGREVARKAKRPRKIVVILILAILRISLVPLLMLCNAQPRNFMPVYFGDNIYIILTLVFGASHGFLVSLCIISIPMIAKEEELEFVTILVPLFSVITVTLCSAFNLIIIHLI